MKNIEKEINKVRLKLKVGTKEQTNFSGQKPFAQIMYRFSMFMIDYYSRVKKELKIDYDSFMIVQTCVIHTLYQLTKKPNNSSLSYEELETEWEKIRQLERPATDEFENYIPKSHIKLNISSICLVTNLPKETVRRKVNILTKKNILKISKKNGIFLGKQYSKIFKEFVPVTVHEISNMIKHWERTGILKNIIKF